MDSGKLLSFVILVAVQNFQWTSGSSWGYFAPIGPANWTGTCLNTKQSPVDISNTEYSSGLINFVYTGYNTAPSSLTLKNNGHTAQIDIGGNTVQISGGGLEGSYTAAQWHFHWGSNENQGSEHTWENKKYPMEMHIVHYKNDYGDLTTALGHADGVAVLGYFVEVDNNIQNPGMQKIVNALSNVVSADSTYSGLTSFALSEIVPVEPSDTFFRYEGSLTTPTCNEVVTWTVFSKSLKMTSAQLAEFRTLQSAELNPSTNNNELSDNYRPVQELHGRKIYTNSYTSSGVKTSTSLSVLFMAVIMSFTRNLF